MVIKGSGRGVSLVAARRRGVLARPDGEEHGETGEISTFGNAVGEICCGRVVIKGSGRGAARRRGVLARPDGEEHGETEEFPGFGNAVGEIC